MTEIRETAWKLPLFTFSALLFSMNTQNDDGDDMSERKRNNVLLLLRLLLLLIPFRGIRIFLSFGLDPVQLALSLAQLELHIADSPLVSHYDHFQVLQLHQQVIVFGLLFASERVTYGPRGTTDKGRTDKGRTDIRRRISYGRHGENNEIGCRQWKVRRRE